MKNTIRQVFHSSKFVGGFVIFMLLILTMIIYPLINPGNPLEQIGVGTFAEPGTYVSLYDSLSSPTETMRLPGADEKRLVKSLTDEDRVAMVEWFTAMGIDVSDLDMSDTDAMLDLWFANYDVSAKPKGMTMAKRNYYQRLNNNLLDIRAGDTLIIADKNDETGELEEKKSVNKTDYVNVGDVANVKVLPLGTDNFGRDIFSRVLQGAGSTVSIALATLGIGAVCGSLVGALTGYFGGPADEILMRLNDALTAFPSILLALVVISVLEPGKKSNVIIALGLVFIPSFARVSRTAFASLRDVNYIKSARLMGASSARILAVHMLPNTAPVLLPALTIGFNNAVLAEASMSFLGIGVTPPDASLGYMLSEAQGMLFAAPWYAAGTGLIIVLLVFSVGLLGEGLRRRDKGVA